MSKLATQIIASMREKPDKWGFVDSGRKFIYEDGKKIAMKFGWSGPKLLVGLGPGFTVLDKIRIWFAIRRWKVEYLKTQLKEKE